MLTLIPVSLAQANEFVRQHHRHHKPVAGHKFSIGCSENGRLCAVAIVGRPVSRYLDDGFTLEVNRLCSDGTKNACSILYAAAARAARAMGYRKNYHLHLRHRKRRKPTRRRLDERRACRRQGMDRQPPSCPAALSGANEIPL